MKNLIFHIIEKLYLSIPGNKVYTDALTQCFTRYYFNDVCKQKYKHKSVTVVHFDIDNLKKTNDTFGHSAGNILIKQCVARILSIKGIKDVVRSGGDEFVGFIPTEDFRDPQLENVTTGVYHKPSGEDVLEAVCKADKNCIAKKKQLHKK